MVSPTAALPPGPDAQRAPAMRLAEVVLAGIDDPRRDARFPGGTGPFAGSWDWHSCVHAHWALACIARVHEDEALERVVQQRLGAEALRAEGRWLAERPAFELPYGRAWLLLLLDELGRREVAVVLRDAVSALRAEQEAAVVSWLDRSPYPEQPPRFVATHGSWLFALTMLALSRPRSEAVRAAMPAMRARAEAQRSAIAAQAPLPVDFLYLPAVQAMLDRLDDDPGAASPPPCPEERALLVLPETAPTRADAHSAGAAMVRLWPHAMEAARGDAPSARRVVTALALMFHRVDCWGESFEHVGHWVPQFMWMTEWLARGRP